MYTIVLLIFVVVAAMSFFSAKDNYKEKYQTHQTWFDKWKNNKE